ncbi:MAG: glycoside hydrolase family 9 protein [Steroidobacteraceae bacterium]
MRYTEKVNRVIITVIASGCFGGLAACDGHASPTIDSGASKDIPVDPHILVDQFGYRPGDPKVAVIRNPDVGFDAAEKFTPGPRYEVRRTGDAGVVLAGAPAAWNNGAVEASSGDNGWWFDFSTVSAPGTYFIYDLEKKLRSPNFRIEQQVYKPVLKAAVRMYFYQRSSFAKRPPYAESCWKDDAAYSGRNQDVQAHDITDRNNKAKIKDLSGGWFDAGDTNKYVTNAVQPVHQLLTAYQNNPTAFTDDFNIPESGNGIPDIVDEVKWEIDWLRKMQYPDGSVALKVGALDYPRASPPSSDESPRFYVPSCTSATIAAAGMFAHAAYVYQSFSQLKAAASELTGRAIRAWKNYQGAADKQTSCDSGEVKVAGADWTAPDQEAEAVVAAIYLFGLTGDAAYDEYIRSNYKRLKPYQDIGWSRYKVEQGEALLFYTTLKGANPSLKNAIIADKRADALAGNQIYGFNPEDDLYRDFLHDAQYHWGSNAPRANYGNSNVDVIRYGVVASDSTYGARALEVLHYLHGVNPLAKVYLTNMSSYGAYSSVNELFHAWFWPGTRWADALQSSCGPAPGYVPGGPVADAIGAGVPAAISPPSNQPAQKSYLDWNGNSRDPEKSWIINEPGIYYQSAYVELISNFAH